MSTYSTFLFFYIYIIISTIYFQLSDQTTFLLWIKFFMNQIPIFFFFNIGECGVTKASLTWIKQIEGVFGSIVKEEKSCNDNDNIFKKKQNNLSKNLHVRYYYYYYYYYYY